MPKNFDVFNGDADGICALHQLRLERPLEATRITGVKRDIKLLEKIPAQAKAEITVLDISFHENREAAMRLLEDGSRLLYFDHHYSGEVPSHPGLEAHIQPSPRLCTSLLVNRYLDGKHPAWAVTAAFGDNLIEAAHEAARPLGLTAQELAGLRMLGEILNYNSYGETLSHLRFHPEALYEAVHQYAEPLEFLSRAPEADELLRGFGADFALAENREPLLDAAEGRVYRFPNEAWAHRVMGVFANRVANEDAQRATAVILENADGTLRVSVRAPKARPAGADALCRRFAGGGGRGNAAGISSLPESELQGFLAGFQSTFEEGAGAQEPWGSGPG